MNSTQTNEFLHMMGNLVRAQVRLAGMQAENDVRRLAGMEPVYRQNDFEDLINAECIGVNQVTEATHRIAAAS